MQTKDLQNSPTQIQRELLAVPLCVIHPVWWTLEQWHSAGSQDTFPESSALLREPCFVSSKDPNCLTKTKSDHLIRNEKTFHIPPTLNSSNFQQFEFMSVKSLMNFQRLPGKEGVVAGIISGNWSSCRARVNQGVKRNRGSLGQLRKWPKVQQDEWQSLQPPNGAIAMGHSSHCELSGAWVLLTVNTNVYK